MGSWHDIEISFSNICLNSVMIICYYAHESIWIRNELERRPLLYILCFIVLYHYLFSTSRLKAQGRLKHKGTFYECHVCWLGHVKCTTVSLNVFINNSLLLFFSTQITCSSLNMWCYICTRCRSLNISTVIIVDHTFVCSYKTEAPFSWI